MKLYKLTDCNGKTRAGECNELQWGTGVTHTAKGEGTSLCSPDLIHAYEHPFLGVIMNSVHAGFPTDTMRMWEAEGEVVVRDRQLKCGVKTLTTLREIPIPIASKELLAEFSIRVALHLNSPYFPTDFVMWANNWLNGNKMSSERAFYIHRTISTRLQCLISSEERWVLEVAYYCITSPYCADPNPYICAGSVAQGAVYLVPSFDLISILEEVQNKQI